MKLVQRRRAVEDIDEHAAYIAERNTRAAYRFLDKVEQAYEILRRHPRIGFVTRGAVQIVRIVHASRDLE